MPDYGEKMIDLDNQSSYEEIDPSGLRWRLQGIPAQCSQAWSEARKTQFPDEWQNCTEVIVAGMGGSAIAGDLAADLVGQHSGVPIRVVRDFRIPGPLSETRPNHSIKPRPPRGTITSISSVNCNNAPTAARSAVSTT